MTTLSATESSAIPDLPSAGVQTREVQVTYDDRIVRRFILASAIWAAVGMLVGLLAALQLAFPDLNLAPWLSFGRIRPLHTNAVIFAFVGNMMFAGIYYSTQRLTKARMHDALSKIHFWGWQLIIVAAAITLPLGISQSKEYAELEWPIDIAVTLIWVVFAANFFYALYKRREKHLYVALWFYISTIVTVAVLYIVNNLALPIMSGVKSYSIYAGAQDALVQWWYGHNAVAFFLTTPILGIMYYFLPKAANRPVYSYRLSIIHFWALVFLYIWAGPHHLLYTSLPDWAQSLGMIFSIMLWAPSWGGMINGLLTLRGAWHLLRTDPVIKFFIAAITFYGMATFEGPLLSIKAVSALGHYTDWIIGHVHTGALGWNGFMAAGLIYWLVPRLFGTKLYSKKAADAHFWMATLGILLYAVSMWISGISQGLMWRATSDSGRLTYDFLETTRSIWPMYVMRAVGGFLYLAGWFILLWNVWKTVRSGKATDVTVTATEVIKSTAPKEAHWAHIVFAPPLALTYMLIIAMGVYFLTDIIGAAIALGFMAFIFILTLMVMGNRNPALGGEHVHRVLEGRPLIMTILVTIAILVGGVAELVPTLTISKAVPLTQETSDGVAQTPYTPLELHGRDIYVREGCYTCHSQQIRPFVWEKLRYGSPSVAGESRYDHPFQWGSKRTGPDLAREGTNAGKSAVWHYQHMIDPRSTSKGSVMPAYPQLETDKIDIDDGALKLSAMKTLGVPYTAENIANASLLTELQGKQIQALLAKDGIDLPWDSELTAVIAYLTRLGKQPDDPIGELMGQTSASSQAPAGTQAARFPGAPTAMGAASAGSPAAATP
ncbi:MAG: cytochrome-c oxidase, cbb3-type subunit I [Deltaproteobacteria bacterium]|nr:cytochrome-c oxidase, cbb3-type subunit I [Deltaproteobacteria bacterium]